MMATELRKPKWVPPDLFRLQVAGCVLHMLNFVPFPHLFIVIVCVAMFSQTYLYPFKVA